MAGGDSLKWALLPRLYNTAVVPVEIKCGVKDDNDIREKCNGQWTWK